MFRNKINFCLFLVVLLAFILRFYKLGLIPTGLEWDEVAIGYDAYSVLKTGRDQFGNFLPLTFRSLDDYKPPLYEYLTIPAIAIFDLNEFSVRFPSAFFGSLSVLMTFYLVEKLFKDQNKIIALLSAFLLAISPWHLQFSRAAFEVNLSVFLLISAVFFFLKGLTNPKFFILASLFFGLGFFSYHSTRFVMPLLLLTLVLSHLKNIDFKSKATLISLFLYFVFILAFLPILFSKEAQMRFKVTNISNIFTDIETVRSLSLAQKVDGKDITDPIFRFFHGKKPILMRVLIFNYLVHFNPVFLFIKGDVPLHHAPDFGLLYLFELPFLLMGLFFFLKDYLIRLNLVLLVWFLIAPLPAAVTLQVPHAVRTELFLPTFQIFTALGLYLFFSFIKKKRPLFFALILIFFLFFYSNMSLYLHQYYVHTPYELSRQWMYGRKEAALFVDEIKHKYDKVIVSVTLEHPHIFFLFYLKYDPAAYLAEGGTFSGGWAVDNNRFDKYEFKYITYEELKDMYSNSLVVARAEEIPNNVKTLKTIYYLNGEEAIKIIEI